MQADTPKPWRVEVIEDDTQEVVKTIECHTEREAQRVERGLLIFEAVFLKNNRRVFILAPFKSYGCRGHSHWHAVNDDLRAGRFRVEGDRLRCSLHDARTTACH